MTTPLYTVTGAPVQGSKGQSSSMRTEFAAIETAMDKLANVPLFCYAADINTAGSFWIPTPGWAGTIETVYAVNYVANTTTKTVLTIEIGGAAVTLAAAWEIAITAAVGTQSTATGSSSNAFTAGVPIEIISDGGGAPVMPVMICALIARTS